MKKLFFTLAIFFSAFSLAQDKFEKAMTSKIENIEKHNSLEEFEALSNDFARIGDAEKTQWLPFYYAAFSQIQKGRLLMRENKVEELDKIADAAQEHLDKAFALNSEESELYVLKKMIHSLRMMVDPMSRYMTEGGQAAEALQKAEQLNPDNPRIILLKAEDTFFTPEQYGGSKEKGLELFKQSLEMFSTFKPSSAISPNWGKAEAEYFLSSGK